MDIYLSVNNREEVLLIPVMPSEFTVTKPHSNEVFDTVDAGQLNLIGHEGLKTVAWSSIFPARDYPFNRTLVNLYFDNIYTLDRWYRSKLPMRLIITETDINMACTIEDFSYAIKQNRDIEYSISLSEVILR